MYDTHIRRRIKCYNTRNDLFLLCFISMLIISRVSNAIAFRDGFSRSRLETPEMFHSFGVADPFHSSGEVCLGIIRAVGTFYLPINPELAIGPGS